MSLSRLAQLRGILNDNAKLKRMYADLAFNSPCWATVARWWPMALRRWPAGAGETALPLTDLHMPVMDGYSLAAAIRSDEAAGAARLRSAQPAHVSHFRSTGRPERAV